MSVKNITKKKDKININSSKLELSFYLYGLACLICNSTVILLSESDCDDPVSSIQSTYYQILNGFKHNTTLYEFDELFLPCMILFKLTIKIVENELKYLNCENKEKFRKHMDVCWNYFNILFLNRVSF